MGHFFSSKLDSTLRYASEKYGLAASVLADIASALANAATAQATANAAGSSASTANANLATHVGSNGAAHALATASLHGFMPSQHFTKVSALFPTQGTTVGRLTVDALLEVPTFLAYAASIPFDTALKNDFVVGALTGNTTLVFTNTTGGHQGFVAVRQDATGGRTVTFTPPAGFTLYRDANTANLTAAAGANAVTVYTYACVVVGGLNMMFIGKLTPVAA